jgi:FdhE protein
MMGSETGLQDLKRRYPEWEPWLAVVQVILRDVGDSRWDLAVPSEGARQDGKAPLLAQVSLELEESSIRPILERLTRACGSGLPKMATLQAVSYGDFDVFPLFRAALQQDGNVIKEISSTLGADPEALQAVASLLPMPFLHACRRRWAAAISAGWMEGYCSVCGAWPAFAEVRGIERSRYLRCVRCGSEWQSHCLFCLYCGMDDHKELESLVPEPGGSTRMIEACRRCRRYIKALTSLQGAAPEEVLIEDLASVDLDIAALDQGYKKPDGPGYSLDVTVTNKPGLNKSWFFSRG